MPKLSQIEYWELDKIQPYKNNAKLHPDFQLEQIANSIEKFSFLDPVVVDENGVLLEGHGRLLVAKCKNIASIPVIQALGLTEAQKIAYRIAHNKLTVNTGFDTSALKIDFDLLSDLNFNLDLTGFNSEELDLSSEISRKLANGKGSSDEPDNYIARCEFGQTWQLGRHKLHCGDSTDFEVVQQLLGDRIPNFIWSDPPYGIKCQHEDGSIGGNSNNYKAKKYPVIANDDSTDVAKASFSLCQQLFPRGVQIWWGANHYNEGLPNSPCWIVWDKLNGDSSFADCELAWTNLKGAVRKFSFLWNGMQKQGEAANQKRIHPNQKPIEMVEWFWDNYCEGNICFDPFLGSGATIMAAEKTTVRVVFGCELMPEYCDLILTRWEEKTGEKAKLLS